MLGAWAAIRWGCRAECGEEKPVPPPDEKVFVTLARSEMFIAGMVGVLRNIDGYGKKGRYGHDNAKSGWQNDCDGSCGEMSASKWLNVYWNGNLGDFAAKDAGIYQVRTNPYEWGHLILHPGDRDGDKFILVCSANAPRFQLVGWAFGREGKKQEYWRDGQKGRPAFFAPQDILHPMSTLRSDEIKPVNGGLRSHCRVHGAYPGDGNCPGCEREWLEGR
jgi:hypothetical protein